ncbi:MAG: hypothetical protein AABX16_00625 [Nanoarchaeota archaeon]
MEYEAKYIVNVIAIKGNDGRWENAYEGSQLREYRFSAENDGQAKK